MKALREAFTTNSALSGNHSLSEVLLPEMMHRYYTSDIIYPMRNNTDPVVPIVRSLGEHRPSRRPRTESAVRYPNQATIQTGLPNLTSTQNRYEPLLRILQCLSEGVAVGLQRLVFRKSG